MTLTDDDVSNLLQNYIRRPRELTEQAHAMNISKIARFLRNQQTTLQEIHARQPPSCPTFSNLDLNCRHSAMCRQIREWLDALTTQITDFEVSRREILINSVTVLLDYVQQNPPTVGCLARLSEDWQTASRENALYNAWCAQRHILKIRLDHIIRKASKVPDSLLLRSSLVDASARLDPDRLYTPPSDFESQLEEYVKRDQILMSALIAGAMIITDVAPKSLMYTIGELNKAVLSSLGITGGPLVTTVYLALVRILFQISYTQNSAPLSGHFQANAHFLTGCELFAKQTVRQLDLCEAIATKFTPGLPIPTLFKSKQIGLLKPMEWMTNPIDLVSRIDQILVQLASFFSVEEGFLSFDDTLGLLLALLSIGPPSNAVAIARFLRTWECVLLSQHSSHASSVFIAAVEHILAFARDQSSGSGPTE
jgi:hypothetical protein